MKLLETKKKIEARKAEARARLKQLRVDMADDVAVDPGEVAQIMRNAGVDFEELERQVAKLKQRRAMVAQIDEYKSQYARAAEIGEELKEAEAAFSVVLQKHQHHVTKLRQEEAVLAGRFNIPSVEAQLHRGATDPEIQAAKEELRKERQSLAQRQNGLEYQQRNHSVESSRLKSEIKRQRSLGYTPKPRLAEDAKLHENKASEIGTEIRRIREECNELDARLDELRSQELEPNAF